MGQRVQISLRRQEGARFVAHNSTGQSCIVDGPPELGGTGQGLRPMELVLVSLAGCSALDVLHIMQKQRQPLEDLSVEVTGERAEAVPAVYSHIRARFVGSGAIDLEKLRHAVDLSFEKYCSVARMLAPTVQIVFEAAVAAS